MDIVPNDEIIIPLTWSPCCIPRHEQEELVRTSINALCGDQTSNEKYNNESVLYLPPPGLKPGLLASELTALTMRPPHKHITVKHLIMRGTILWGVSTYWNFKIRLARI